MTDVNIKEYLESQIKWLDKYFQSQICAIKQAADKAEQAWPTKTEVNTRFDNIEDRIKKLELTKASNEGKVTIIAFVVSAVVSLVTALIIVYFR